jgi:hypothetical protein
MEHDAEFSGRLVIGSALSYQKAAIHQYPRSTAEVQPPRSGQWFCRYEPLLKPEGSLPSLRCGFYRQSSKSVQHIG